MKLIKSVSGIRGIYNKSLFISDIITYAFAFSEIQKNYNLPILIARDSRISGFEITNSIIDFFKTNGRDIIDCGIIPTPTAQFITDKFDIAGAIVITASHNPQEWNGMKFIDSNGTFLNKDKNKKLFKFAGSANQSNLKDKNFQSKSSTFIEAIDLHINNVLNINFLEVDKIKNKKIKIVLDTINGARLSAAKPSKTPSEAPYLLKLVIK